MRAALIREFGAPSVVETAEVDDPLVGPDTVLVSVRAAGVNPVDWKVIAGGLRGAFPHHLPLIPGWDVAGVVESVGPAVTEVAPGDRVLAYARKDHVQNGTFAEKVAVPVRAVAKIPNGLGFAPAAALPLAGLTAEQLLDAAEVSKADTVLVHNAAGGVGSFAVQLAAMRGARVIGTASPARHDYVRSLGGEPVEYGDGLVQRVRDIASEGVDVALDLVGGEALSVTPELLASGGRVASVIDPAQVSELGGRYVFVRPDADMLDRLARYVADGQVRVEVAETFPLERAAEALARNREGHTRGKIVVTVS
ncbi:MAG TPA: NADP-dependent oxidoreductase [Nocardioidaceae bacterium]|nr:NADP-dependent oxidoreductase [Nocardioidaceae bacterium]